MEGSKVDFAASDPPFRDGEDELAGTTPSGATGTLANDALSHNSPAFPEPGSFLSLLTTFLRLPISSDHFRVRFNPICLVKSDRKMGSCGQR
jgi:hypothetical protein